MCIGGNVIHKHGLNSKQSMYVFIHISYIWCFQGIQNENIAQK